MNYAMEFRVVGEVADMLLLNKNVRKLLIDVSPDLPGHEVKALKEYPTRTTVTVTDSDLIDDLIASLKVGQVVEAEGTFRQSDYVPHKTTYIDTTFTASSFRVIKEITLSTEQIARLPQERELAVLH